MEDQKDQRAKTEAEQRSALEAANSMRDAITTEPAQATPGADVQAEPVSRTPTGTSA
jgi:hypothetical protein